jgi:hypothetical protein
MLLLSSHQLLFALATVSTVSAAVTCGNAEAFTDTYLGSLINSAGGGISNFVPSAYFEGGAVKFVTTRNDRQIDHPELCVDGTTTAEAIQLYDDGTNGDDVAGDGVYSRACVHFCASFVNYTDFWGYAFEREINGVKLIAVDPNLEGKIPSVTLPMPLHPGATLLATSHAAFFADVDRTYFPDWPNSRGDNGDAPSGKSMAIAALLTVFGDVFDYLTFAGFESNTAIQGAGVSCCETNLRATRNG